MFSGGRERAHWNQMCCFAKCGIFSEIARRAVTYEDDLFKELQNEIDLRRGCHPEVALGKITCKDLVDVDDEFNN